MFHLPGPQGRLSLLQDPGYDGSHIVIQPEPDSSAQPLEDLVVTRK